MVEAVISIFRPTRGRHARQKTRRSTRIIAFLKPAVLIVVLSATTILGAMAGALRNVSSSTMPVFGVVAREWKHEATMSAILLLDTIALRYDIFRMRERRYVYRRHRQFIHDIIRSFKLLLLSFVTVVFGGFAIFQIVIIPLPEGIYLLLNRMGQLHTMDIGVYDFPWSQAIIVGAFGLLLLFIVASARAAVPGVGRDVVVPLGVGGWVLIRSTPAFIRSVPSRMTRAKTRITRAKKLLFG